MTVCYIQHMELVDVLLPPDFRKSGVIKPRDEAYQAGEWLGGFNLWIVQSEPEPAIVYQQRSPLASWEPNKLDTSAAGHYLAGETLYDGLREAKEEVGKIYDTRDLTYIGRKMSVVYDVHNVLRHGIVDVCLVTDNSPLTEFVLQKEEVFALYRCPIAELLKVHTAAGYSFIASGITAEGEAVKMEVSEAVFPFSWDKYHFKMALLADRYLKGESNLVY